MLEGQACRLWGLPSAFSRHMHESPSKVVAGTTTQRGWAGKLLNVAPHSTGGKRPSCLILTCKKLEIGKTFKLASTPATSSELLAIRQQMSPRNHPLPDVPKNSA